MTPEPSIVINGHVLTEGQAMTVRVALSQFASSLEPNELIDQGYKARLVEIFNMIVPPSTRTLKNNSQTEK